MNSTPRANNAISVLHLNPPWLDKKLMNSRGIVEVPKKAERLPPTRAPTRNGRNLRQKRKRKKRSSVCFTVSAPWALPFVLLPGTPKDRVQILGAGFTQNRQKLRFPGRFRQALRRQ